MPEFDVQTLAVADRYAAALLQLAAQGEREEEIASAFADLAGYLDRDPDFDRFLASATVDDDQRAATLNKLFEGKLPDLLLSLVQILNRRRRTRLIRAVQRCVQIRMEARRGQREIRVETAVPLWHEVRTAIRAVVGGWMGKTAIITEAVRPEIIGGIVIQVGDTRVDGSVASRIEAVRRRMLDRMTREVNQGSKYVTDMQELYEPPTRPANGTSS